MWLGVSLGDLSRTPAAYTFRLEEQQEAGVQEGSVAAMAVNAAVATVVVFDAVMVVWLFMLEVKMVWLLSL